MNNLNTSMQGQKQVLSVNVAAVKVIDELKKVKRGLSLEEIEKRTNLVVNPGLLEALKKNQHLEFNEKNQRFVYKFKYNINTKEDVLEYLKEGPLLIADDVEGTYEQIAEDIQEMKENHLILVVQHQSKKKDVIYLQPHHQNEDIAWEMSQDIRDFWKTVPVIDSVDLRRFLEKNKSKLAQLDTNVVPEEFRRNKAKSDSDKNKSKRKRRSGGKSNISSELALLAQQIHSKALSSNDEGNIKLTPGITDDDLDDQKKQSLLYHNIEANPEEFELVSDLIRIVGHWFYDDKCVVTLNEFLKQKYHKDTDLSKSLLLPQKQVGMILQQLNIHQLLSKRTCEQGNRQINVYEMDLDKFTNICNYRILKMQDMLVEEINELGSAIFQCPNCKHRYKALDLPILFDSGTARHCNNGYCRTPLSGIDNSERLEKEKLLEKVKQELTPLQDIIAKLTHSKEVKSTGKVTARRPMPPRRPPRRPMSGGEKLVPIVTSVATSKEKEYDLPPEPQSDFDTCPLYFSKNFDVFLHISQTWEELETNIAVRLAKSVLDEVAEFQHIVNSMIYVYKITDHSLYLAWTRGYSPGEVVRLLKLLTKNPLPMSLEKFIRENVNNLKYYKATMTLRNRHYCIQAEGREVLEKLLSKSGIRELVPQATALQEVTSGTGKVTYHFPINPGQSEKVKRVCRDLGVLLVDEFDFASTPTLQSININMKPNTKVRSYQEFAVSRLFWNGFRCHSGILVLPCGAGKTLIGINVVAALKKPCIIFCQSILAVTQWKDQMTKWTTIPEASVSRFSSNHPMEWNPGAEVLITTYGMFSANTNRSGDSQNMMHNIKEREWGLMILDEVHLVPAKIFRKVTNQIRSHVKMGLTATMVREDELIQDLPQLVGPKLFELDIFTLRMHNYISPVECVELHCPMTETFKRAYSAAQTLEEERMLYSTNPNKTRVVWALIKSHIEKKHRIMVFCDNLFCLNFYTGIIKRPKIDGSTPQDERVSVLRNFRESGEGDCVLFSQVGDQSIDLPEADVVIQVALMHGGRMQEGQRIGRIQRPQPGKLKAYFYSLISTGTKEEEFAKKRRNFLQDHGYSIKREKNYEKFLTDDTLHVVEEGTQQGIIAAVKSELLKREHKRIYGEPEKAQSTGKRKRENSKKEIQKKLKFAK